jgi:hypothetical protein
VVVGTVLLVIFHRLKLGKAARAPALVGG